MLKMPAFNAEYLIDLMLKTNNKPQARLLRLFDLLDDILKKSLHTAPLQNTPNENTLQSAIFSPTLSAFCVKLGVASHAKNPTVLADHILFIAQNAFNQQMHQPEINHLMHAKKVANALMLAQTTQQFSFAQLFTLQHAMIGALSICLALVSGFLLWPMFSHNGQVLTPLIAQSALKMSAVKISAVKMQARSPDSALTAAEASAMYAKFETMRKGTCQFIEALQIPEKDQSVYLENVVKGKIPTNLKDLATANAYLEKIHCNYTPMLMRASK